MSHELLTVVVSYNRPELLQRTIDSYVDTVTLKHRLIIVDNASDIPTQKILRQLKRGTATVILLDRNRYPGYATNHGWRFGINQRTTLLHRSDNDVEYLPGWCDEVTACFEHERLGQLGLRTTEEEGNVGAVGGNCVIRREVWQAGGMYSEEPWTSVPFEDGIMSQHVSQLGYVWGRVANPCIVHIGQASREDPYYQQTFAERRIDFAWYGL